MKVYVDLCRATVLRTTSWDSPRKWWRLERSGSYVRNVRKYSKSGSRWTPRERERERELRSSSVARGTYRTVQMRIDSGFHEELLDDIMYRTCVPLLYLRCRLVLNRTTTS